MAALNFPPDPNDGASFTASNNITYVYTTNKWTSVGAIVDNDPDAGFKVDVGDTAPLNPAIGNLWYNTNRGVMYVWYQDQDQSGTEGQWTDVRPPS